MVTLKMIGKIIFLQGANMRYSIICTLNCLHTSWGFDSVTKCAGMPVQIHCDCYYLTGYNWSTIYLMCEDSVHLYKECKSISGCDMSSVTLLH